MTVVSDRNAAGDAAGWESVVAAQYFDEYARTGLASGQLAPAVGKYALVLATSVCLLHQTAREGGPELCFLADSVAPPTRSCPGEVSCDRQPPSQMRNGCLRSKASDGFRAQGNAGT